MCRKRHPQTNVQSADSVFDFMGLSPETMHQFVYLFGDRGIPDGFRHMNGYSSHTLKFVNGEGVGTWVKFHFKTESGIKNLTEEQAAEIQKSDMDYATRDLFEHIENGGEAAWRVYVQLMPYEDAETYRFNPFDITKVWPHCDYPLVELGRMVLNENPKNYFAEIEQAAFSPSHMVPGIAPSPDKMLQGRLFSYPDTHRHRLGANYHQIPVNCPYRTKNSGNYQRDGPMTVTNNGGSAINYEPNSFSGPRESKTTVAHNPKVDAHIGRYRYSHPNDDFVQARDLYEKIMDAGEKQRMIKAVVGAMSGCTREDIKVRACRNFFRVHPELGTKIALGVGVPVTAVKSNL